MNVKIKEKIQNLDLIKFKMSRVFDFFQDVIKSCNVFTSPVNLRYKLDPDYNTFAGGIVSIALIILLMSVFFNAWMELLNKEAISSSTEIVRQFDPGYMEVNSDDFMFAIGVTGLNMSDTTQRKYFNLKMTKYYVQNSPVYKKSQTAFNLQPCTQNHWQQLGGEFVDTFKRQELSKFLCVPRNFTIEIAGKYTSQKFIYYKLSIEKCTGSNCRNQSQIDAWVLANSSFYLNFYYSNTLLNPDQQEPISMFFEDKDYTMFSPAMATSTNLYLGQYIMNTDESIFPWTQQHLQTGFILNRAQKQFWNYMSTPSQPYCKLYIRKSNIRLDIDRKFRKLDDMLSYIGGLFGIIAVAFGFVMNYYGQCCFELQMCQNIFDYHNKKDDKQNLNQNLQNQSQQLNQLNKNNDNDNKDGWEMNQQNEKQEVIQPKDFGFLDFFLHIIYIPLKKICNLKWRRMQIYEESLEEMRYKLDVSQLLEKISFYDRSLNVLFDEHQLKLLYLQQKYNFQEVREERNLLGLRKDIIANLFGMVADTIPKNQHDTIQQQKKTLKQIAVDKSRKRLQTFIGKSVNFFDVFAQAAMKQAGSQNQIDINIPDEIKSALKLLDQKIEQGDIVSIRIYNGLQYELLEAFEKSKMKKTKHCVTTNKKVEKKLRIKEDRNSVARHQNLMFSNIFPNNSATSIINLNSGE